MSQAPQRNRALRFAAFEVDLRAGELRKHGLRIRLQDQPFQILAMLLEQPGEMVTREELRQRLWPADTFVDFDHSLNTAINKLREALSDSAENPRYIETLPRRGYRFLAAVEVVHREAAPAPTEASPAPAAEELLPAAQPSQGRERQWLGRAIVAAVAVIVVVLLIANRQTLRDWFSGGRSQRIESIAVLPLENLSGDPEQEYFADGMTDALITNLTRIGSLRVISRTSSMQYKKARKTLPQIAKELKVDGIIEGTVQRAGNQVRISVQLLHGPTDTHLWASDYERDLSDIVTLQREMARAVAEEIRIRLTPEESQRLEGGATVNPEAYEAYLRGRFFWNKRTEEGLRRSLAYFQQVIETDPKYVRAYVGLSDLHNSLGFYGLRPPRETYPRAKELALKALALDDTVAEAHTSLASVLADYEWDWAGAEREFQRAIALNPNYEGAHQWYADHLVFMGRLAEARKEIERAQDLDPLSLIISSDVALYHYYSRDYDGAIAEARRMLELEPDYPLGHIWLGMAYVQQGKATESVEEFRKAKGMQGNLMALALLGHAYGCAGRRAEALAVIQELEKASGTRFVSAAYFTLVYLGLGDRAKFFEWFEKSYQERSALMIRLKVEPMLDPVRSDPRFQAFLKRMNFPDAAAQPKPSP